MCILQLETIGKLYMESPTKPSDLKGQLQRVQGLAHFDSP